MENTHITKKEAVAKQAKQLTDKYKTVAPKAEKAPQV